MKLNAFATLSACGALALLVACNLVGEDVDSTADALSCAKIDDPHCGHPIDRIIVPKLRAAGLAPRDGEPTVVCRRMAIDLIGRGPTLAELERCIGLPRLDARADMFMAMPDYVLTQQRAWAETLGFNVELAWYGDVVEMDRMVGRLISGENDYRTFASSIVVYPAFYGLHRGDDWAANVFNVFLGRTARSDELAGMRPLTRMFESRTFCDGFVWSSGYDDALEDGLTGAAATAQANEECIGADNEEYGWNFCGCARGAGSIGCRSTALGTTIDIGSEGCRDPNSETGFENLVRVNDAIIPGKRTQCVTDSGGTRACKDKSVNEDEQVGGALRPLALADASMRQRTGKVGAALAERADFWEAGADRELGRFIGWWKDGVRRPDFDLPEVRTLLAKVLRETGSVRGVQKLIVTSLLYAAPAEPPLTEVGDAPLWSMGSTKLLTAESWLDSAGTATFGKVLGVCDYRFVAIGEVGPSYTVDTTVVRKLEGPLPSFGGANYPAHAQLLGGCSAEQPRPRTSSVGIAYAQHDMARSLCAAAPGVLPPSFSASDTSDAALRKAIDHVVLRSLARPATAEEVATFTDEMRACIGAPGGCRSVEAAVRWLCTRVIDSAEFALY